MLRVDMLQMLARVLPAGTVQAVCEARSQGTDAVTQTLQLVQLKTVTVRPEYSWSLCRHATDAGLGHASWHGR